jgi:hypothetical protein
MRGFPVQHGGTRNQPMATGENSGIFDTYSPQVV